MISVYTIVYDLKTIMKTIANKRLFIEKNNGSLMEKVVPSSINRKRTADLCSNKKEIEDERYQM